MTMNTVGAVLDEGGNVCLVKTAFVNVAASQTDSSVVAAVAGKRIRVLGYTAQCGSSSATLTFNSKGAGAGTAVSSLQQPAANGGRSVSAADGAFLFQTNAGEALTVTTGAGGATGVDLAYIEA